MGTEDWQDVSPIYMVLPLGFALGGLIRNLPGYLSSPLLQCHSVN